MTEAVTPRRRLPLLPLLALLAVGLVVGSLLWNERKHEDFVKAHGHAHHAPHGGALIMLGGHAAHVELLLDESSGRLDAYLLDGHAEHPVRTEARGIELGWRLSGQDAWQSVLLAPVASALSGETVGDTSHFSAEVPALKGQKAFEVRIPPLRLRGPEFPAIETRYPEGNE